MRENQKTEKRSNERKCLEVVLLELVSKKRFGGQLGISIPGMTKSHPATLRKDKLNSPNLKQGNVPNGERNDAENGGLHEKLRHDKLSEIANSCD